MFWEHAHNDLLEFPIELGIPGMLLIVAGAGYLTLLLLRNYFWTKPVSGCISFGLLLVLAHSWWDFPFQCPAILILWCSLAVAATMWTMFEELNVPG